MLPLLAIVDLGAIEMSGYSAFPQISIITVASPLDCLVSCFRTLVVGVLPLCREAVGILYRPSRLGWDCLVSYPEHSLEGVVRHFRDAADVFYSPRRLGQSFSCASRFRGWVNEVVRTVQWIKKPHNHVQTNENFTFKVFGQKSSVECIYI